MIWKVWFRPSLQYTASMNTHAKKVLRSLAKSSAFLRRLVLLIFPFMLAWLLWCTQAGTLSFGAHDRLLDFLLIASGAVTAVPLVLFAYGVRRVPLSTIGLLQYVGPTLQLLTGIFVFSAQVLVYAYVAQVYPATARGAACEQGCRAQTGGQASGVPEQRGKGWRCVHEVAPGDAGAG